MVIWNTGSGKHALCSIPISRSACGVRQSAAEFTPGIPTAPSAPENCLSSQHRLLCTETSWPKPTANGAARIYQLTTPISAATSNCHIHLGAMITRSVTRAARVSTTVKIPAFIPMREFSSSKYHKAKNRIFTPYVKPRIRQP